MAASLEDRLRQAAALTFEELAFMFTDYEAGPQQCAAVFEAGAAIDFHGPFRGRLVIHLYGGLLGTLAANMTGETEVEDPELMADSIKEITNVICGNLLPMVAGSTAVFDLDPPEFLGKAEAGTRSGLLPQGAVVLGIEGGRAEVLFFADRTVEPVP